MIIAQSFDGKFTKVGEVFSSLEIRKVRSLIVDTREILDLDLCSDFNPSGMLRTGSIKDVLNWIRTKNV